MGWFFEGGGVEEKGWNGVKKRVRGWKEEKIDR